MENRVTRFLGGDTIYKKPPLRKSKIKINKMCNSLGWKVDPPIIIALNHGKIDSDTAWILTRISNFCYYDKNGLRHVFWGSDQYLAELSNCSVRSIQRKLKFLEDNDYIFRWSETTKKRNCPPRTRRYISTTWEKNQDRWMRKWLRKLNLDSE